MLSELSSTIASAVGAWPGPGRRAAGRASHAGVAFAQAGRLVPRRGLVVLISDLLLDAEEVIAPVRALRRAGHHVAVLHVLDPAERELIPGARDALFVDPESERAVPAAAADVRAAYRDTVARALAEWRGELARSGVAYEVVSTAAPYGVPLRRAFAARQRLP